MLSNHGLTLIFLAEKPGATTREIANDLGLTERTVQRIVSDLDSAGYIRKEKAGRQNRYKVKHEKPLRHPTRRNKTVGNLLAQLTN